VQNTVRAGATVSRQDWNRERNDQHSA
jgi:hypothetical protein